MIDELISYLQNSLSDAFGSPLIVCLILASLPIVEARLAIPMAFSYGYGGGKREREKKFSFRYNGNRNDLGIFIRIFEPGNKRKKGGRSGHSEIGYNLAVVSEFYRHYTVYDGKNKTQKLPENEPLCNEDKRRYSDERRNKRKPILFVR